MEREEGVEWGRGSIPFQGLSPWRESTPLPMSSSTTTLMTQYENITTQGIRAGEHSRRRRCQSFGPFIILIKTWLEEKHSHERAASTTRGIREDTRIAGEIVRAGKKLNNPHYTLLQCTQNRKSWMRQLFLYLFSSSPLTKHRDHIQKEP